MGDNSRCVEMNFRVLRLRAPGEGPFDHPGAPCNVWLTQRFKRIPPTACVWVMC